MRTGGQELEARLPSGPTGTRPQVEAGRGEDWFKKWWKKDRTQKDEPTGVDRDVTTSRAEKMGRTDRGRGGRNGLAARGCRDRQGPGEQVEVGKTAIAETGGGGRREWTLVQVDRRSKTRRGGRIGCNQRCGSVLGWRMGRESGHRR